MKKVVVILTSLLLVLSGCTKDKKEEEEKEYKRDTSAGVVQEVTYEEYKDLTSKKGNYMILISQTNCGHCKTYKKEVLDVYLPDHNITIYELNLTNENRPAEVYKELEESLGSDFAGTPTTIVFKKKKVAYLKSGVLEVDELDKTVQKYQLDILK